jgi:putative oxidoreductase
MKLARTALRMLVGALFVGHGTQKLLGWFGGQGLDATAEGFDRMGLRPGRRNALVAGGAEAGGGALLAAGVLTPLAAAALVGTMITAIRTVHLKNGPWATNGGWEYNAVLIGAVLGLVESTRDDGSRRGAVVGEAAALAALGAGAVGSWLVTEQARRQVATAA